jgi:hypothetical protein
MLKIVAIVAVLLVVGVAGVCGDPSQRVPGVAHKMIGGTFAAGLANLKARAEK